MASQKTITITALVLSILAALMFASSAYPKLTNGDSATGVPYAEQFTTWGLPSWMRLVVGTLELAGALGLFIRPFRFYAALGLTLLMAGAIVTHLRTPGEAHFAPFPAVLGILTGAIAYLRRGERTLAAATPRGVPQ